MLQARRELLPEQPDQRAALPRWMLQRQITLIKTEGTLRVSFVSGRGVSFFIWVAAQAEWSGWETKTVLAGA
jgi:hypothetical protein